MKRNRSVTAINVFASICLQIATIISGFIIPRIILTTFGSEANGLISSLTQFLNYMALFEGGLSAVVLANLYKPLAERDMEKASQVVATTRRFYNKLAIGFVIYTLVLAVLYSIFTKSSFSFGYIALMTLILAINTFVRYAFSISLRLLLQADKKVYIISFTQIVVVILNILAFVILKNVWPNLHFMEFVSALVFLLQPIIYYLAVGKHLDIKKDAKPDKALLKSRWDGLGVSLATFVHNNTDVVVLTLFVGLKTVSIYSVYVFVTGHLKQLIQSFSSGITPTMGHLYAKKDEKGLNKLFDFYEYMTFVLTSFLFTVGGLLITPFVLLYTSNVTDANYDQPVFGIIILLAEAMFCLKEPFVNLAYVANKFKVVRKHAIIEAAINIILSVILVFPLGLIGIAIGTLTAMTYRTMYHVIYAWKDLIKRSPWKFFEKMMVFGVASLICVVVCAWLLPLNDLSVNNWLVHAVIYAVIMAALIIIISVMFYRKELGKIKGVVKKVMKRGA
ncbi:polysaccharide biosynthesis C-terminal domain-containing protein [Candidatus Saccharibacteria bacterium]|nr:polysaccharide biosynthesis C-terminal domain-containing protein [Candidatus Saccharibacteria bacterium]